MIEKVDQVDIAKVERPPVGSIQWDITITSFGGGERLALSAMVRGGRVVALLVEMVWTLTSTTGRLGV